MTTTRSLSCFTPDEWVPVRDRDDVLEAWGLWCQARADYIACHGSTPSAYVEEKELARALAAYGWE
jgi:hypothetical protein